MEVVGKQASLSQTSAWSTPLPFNADHDPRPPQPRHSAQQVSHPSSSFRLAPTTNASNSDSQISSRMPPTSVRHVDPLPSNPLSLPQDSEPAHPSHALVRSESAPLNVWEDPFSTRFAGLSVDDSFPSHRVTFAPEATTHFDSSDIDLDFFDALPNHSPSDMVDYQHQRPPHPRSSLKPPPPRSKSSIELAGFAAPPSSHSSNPISGSATAPRTFPSQSSLHSTSSMQKRNNTSPWHKSAFDMIQDDFPRTPSPMFSSLLPHQQSTSSNFLDTAFRSRSSQPDRRSRLASTASLDLDLDRISANLSDEPPIVPEPLVQTRNPPRHHRRSMSVNWADDLTGLGQDGHLASAKAGIVSSPSITSFFPTTVPSTTTVKQSTNSTRPGPGATVENVQTTSSTRTNSPPRPINRGPIANSPSRKNSLGVATHAMNARNGSGSSVHNSMFPYHQPVSDRQGQSSFDDLVNSNISDYNYLYDQSDHVNLASTGAQGVHFPSQAYPSAQSQIPGPSNVLNPPQPNLSNPALPNMFPSMGLFPSPFSNNATGINGNAVPQMYPSAFRDELAAADSIKTMSLQMAAFLSAQQQLYAAQVAQMAAIAGSSAFANPGSVPGAHPNAGLGHSGISPQGMQLRNPWEGREPASSHRNPSRQRHQYDHFRGNGVGHSGNGKKVNGMDLSHKSRHLRGNRRGHRSHEDTGMTGGPKNSERGSSGGNSSGVLESGHVRSALLEDFRSTSASIGRGAGSGVGDVNVSSGYTNVTGSPANSWREWKLSELRNHVVEFATDQHGSRFIQQKLESASEEDKMAILSEALTDTQRLMTDVFGNYVVQKLLDHGGKKAIAAIAQELEGRMLPLSLHMYGCRVVQKALEVVGVEKRARLVKELDGHVLKCIRDQNGNHVIQKCVELVEADSVQFIVNAVQGQSVLLAGHSYGCRVVQRILEHGARHQKAPIMKEIMSSVPELIKDQYGNYVIQHVVEHGTKEEREVIMKLVRGEVYELSQHKFASNVVERCLQFGTFEDRQVLIEILISGNGTSSTSSPLHTLVRDQFGNYVVQRVLDVALPPQRDRVVNILKAQVQAIKKYSYGKHIIARLEEHHYHHHHHHHHHHHRSMGSPDAVGSVSLENANKGVKVEDGESKISGPRPMFERGAGGAMVRSMTAGGVNNDVSNLPHNQTGNQFGFFK